MLPNMPRLPTARPAAGRTHWSWGRVGRIGRGRFGRVVGVLLESRLEIVELLLERGDLLLEGQQWLSDDECRLHERLHRGWGRGPICRGDAWWWWLRVVHAGSMWASGEPVK